MPVITAWFRPKNGEEDLAPWLRISDRLLSIVEWIFGIVATVALLLLVSNTAINAAMRTVFSTQIPGSLNITILYLLPPIVFLGLVVVQANNSHIAATLVVERLGPASRRICAIVVNILIAFGSYMMATGAWDELIRSWGQSLGGSPDLPVGPTWLFVPIGFIFVAIRAIHQVIVHTFYPSVVLNTTAKTADERSMDDA